MLARSLFNERDKGSKNLVIVTYDLYLENKTDERKRSIICNFELYVFGTKTRISFTDIHITI